MIRTIKIILGLIQSLASMYWISMMINYYYLYHYTDVLFAFMMADWELALNIILGLINLNFGIKLILNAVTILRSISVLLITIIIGFAITFMFYQIDF